MSDEGIFVYVLCLIIYTISSILIIKHLKTLIGAIIGSSCLVVGSVALYYIIPVIVALLYGLLIFFITLATIIGIYFVTFLFEIKNKLF